MPKPDGTMTFEEFMKYLGATTQFDEGDTEKTFQKLGEEFLKEGLRKEEKARLRRLRKKRNL
jgi:hypothetical protein